MLTIFRLIDSSYYSQHLLINTRNIVAYLTRDYYDRDEVAGLG